MPVVSCKTRTCELFHSVYLTLLNLSLFFNKRNQIKEGSEKAKVAGAFGWLWHLVVIGSLCNMIDRKYREKKCWNPAGMHEWPKKQISSGIILCFGIKCSIEQLLNFILLSFLFLIFFLLKLFKKINKYRDIKIRMQRITSSFIFVSLTMHHVSWASVSRQKENKSQNRSRETGTI